MVTADLCKDHRELYFVLKVIKGLTKRKRKIYLQSFVTEKTMVWSRVDVGKLGGEDTFLKAVEKHC